MKGPRALACSLLLCSAALAGPGPVFQADVDGVIGPATANYLERAIDEAESAGGECLVIRLDTPGGLLESTKTIVQDILGSAVPVVVWVGPDGASATSAGCFITLAADVAVMAPATTIGAAHPVQIGGGAPAEGEPPKPDETMQQKLENYAVSYIESIAARRNRNVEWARSAVKESASISSAKALELQVIDLIVEDRAELLVQLDGRTVRGRELATAGAAVSKIPMTFREQAFQVLGRPEVMFILMLIAVYGIIGELSHPGAIIPGVIGAIALVLALFMAAILPINVAGLLLVVLALALFLAEAFTPTFGILTMAGVVSFIIGFLMMFDRPEPLFRLSLVYIVPAAILTAGFFVFVVAAGIKAQFRPIRAGREVMIGQVVAASSAIDGKGGHVFIEGESWNAVSEKPVAADQPVEVTGIRGLTLEVRPADGNPATTT
jgi:membrane-bound serine protease (ClpP class)